MQERELEGEELKNEILKAVKEYLAGEMLKNGFAKEDPDPHRERGAGVVAEKEETEDS
jgi:hypothetical protein